MGHVILLFESKIDAYLKKAIVSNSEHIELIITKNETVFQTAEVLVFGVSGGLLLLFNKNFNIRSYYI